MNTEPMPREERRSQLESELRFLSPERVYAGLVAHALAVKRRRDENWVERAFAEIFIRWPSAEERLLAPWTSILVEEWPKVRASTYRAYHPRDLTDDELAAIPPECRC